MDLPVFIDLPKSAVFQLKIIDCLRKNHHQKNFITDADLTAQAVQDATKFSATEGLNYSAEKIAHTVQFCFLMIYGFLCKNKARLIWGKKK